MPGTLVDNSSSSWEGWPRPNSLKETVSQVSSAQASTFDEKEVQTDRGDQSAFANSLNGDGTMVTLTDDTIPGLEFLLQYYKEDYNSGGE